MISLAILGGSFLVLLTLQLWAMARAARAVGSPRGLMRVALAAVVIATLINVAIDFARERFFTPDPAHPLLAVILSAVVSLGVSYAVLAGAFQLSLVRTLAPFAVIIAAAFVSVAIAMFGIKPYLVEAFVFPTHSMMPTINPGDRFTVNKLLRPRRWDLVAYRTQMPGNSIFCKRLIGLPGDHLRFQDGSLFINDQLAPGPKLLEGRWHASTPRNAEPRYAEGETITLGADEYFLVGDNIDISGDSRHEGPSKAGALIGVVDFMYWPMNRVRVVR